MTFWERTWEERGEVLKRAYGDTSPPDTVISFSWRDRIRCPGACALPLPPVDASRDPLRHRRDDWLYLTMGLSQPLDQREVDAAREAGSPYSSRGFELGFLVPDQCGWPAEVLQGLMTLITDDVPIQWGTHFPFGFTRRDSGELAGFGGRAEDASVAPCGPIRALLFWRYLIPDWELSTSTGEFIILIGTGITAEEWQHSRATTAAHLMLLLCRAGIGQRTIADRECLFEIARWQDEWREIEKLDPQECEQQLDAGVGKWNLSQE